MADEYNFKELTGSARKLTSITPSDSTELEFVTRALYIGGAGNISVVAADDTSAVILSVAAGAILPIRAKKVNSTSTTATGIVGLL